MNGYRLGRRWVGRQVLCSDTLGAEGSSACLEDSHQPQALGLGAAAGILAASTCPDTLLCAKYDSANAESIKINISALK